MALKITCPNCGPRPYLEFWFGGESVAHASAAHASAAHASAALVGATLASAAHAGDVDPPEDLDSDYERTWLRANVAGPQRERWFHYAGCRRWHTAERNTLTNEIRALD